MADVAAVQVLHTTCYTQHLLQSYLLQQYRRYMSRLVTGWIGGVEWTSSKEWLGHYDHQCPTKHTRDAKHIGQITAQLLGRAAPAT